MFDARIRESHSETSPRGSALEVLRIFLRLGLTSFGGPMAHIGYFRDAFVLRRAWLSESEFAQWLAICQLLPGPASSQLGFVIGLQRAGWRGALAAFVGFTLPSAALLFALALVLPQWHADWGMAVLQGLKLAAVCVVAQALAGMARQLTPDLPRRVIALSSLALMLGIAQPWIQGLIILGGAIGGMALCRSASIAPADLPPLRLGRRLAVCATALYLALLILALSIDVAQPTPLSLMAVFYRAGALVFGGGHVVLPLLEQSVIDSGWISAEHFLAGYGAAQAVPGPLFAVAAYLGAAAPIGCTPALSAVLALGALFLPGFLLLIAALHQWRRLVRMSRASAAIAGIHAAVVGLLAAALYDPVARDSLHSASDALIVVAGLTLLIGFRVSAPWVVVSCLGLSLLRAVAA